MTPTIDTRRVTADVCADILVTAFDGTYGGCNYWLVAEECEFVKIEKGPDGERWDVVVFTTGNAEWPGIPTAKVAFNHDSVRRGIKLILDGTVSIRDDLADQVRTALDPEEFDVDAGAADCIIQAAAFNELVYG